MNLFSLSLFNNVFAASFLGCSYCPFDFELVVCVNLRFNFASCIQHIYIRFSMFYMMSYIKVIQATLYDCG